MLCVVKPEISEGRGVERERDTESESMNESNWGLQ